MPLMTRSNPGVPVPADLGNIVLVIAGADLGDAIFLGCTANYTAFFALWHPESRTSAVGDDGGAALDRDCRGKGCRSETTLGFRK